MKKQIIYFCVSALIIFASCSEKSNPKSDFVQKKIESKLPYTSINLIDLTAFKSVSENWKLAGSIYADKSEKHRIQTNKGIGVLVNTPSEGINDHLFTVFEHGDIELELDVMMPKGSNSGLFFQSRYEVQLFDSWGAKQPSHVDMGGIYERWDTTKEKGNEGYEGHAPKLNAAKAPGLWQHLRVIFHAPKFDALGNKTKNAWFEKVWLNGVLVQTNIEVSGVTRDAPFQDEISLAPLMIQGDHGPVAFKNIFYKLYNDSAIALKEVTVKTFESPSEQLLSLDNLEVLNTRKTDSISPITEVDPNGKTILEYTGTMDVPTAGDYLFEIRVDGGAAFLMNKDTVINMNGNFRLDSLGLGKITLNKGNVPFKLMYNKHTPWRRGFEFYVQGPRMQRYSVQEPSALASDPLDTSDFLIDVSKEPIAQRSFWMHEGLKRTHCISVGMPQGIHYTYDLEAGSLLQLWDGDFMDATQMWLSRGEKQLGAPRGFVVSVHGDPEFTFLETENSVWPETVQENPEFRQLGYEFDNQGVPTFSSKLKRITIESGFLPSEAERMMQRILTVEGEGEVWHKLADGEAISELPDGTFIINDESYFIDFPENASLEPMIRNSNGKDELLINIPSGKHIIKYSIIW